MGNSPIQFLVLSSVAKKILELEKHKVVLGADCSIPLEARPVHLMVPKVVEVRQSERSPVLQSGGADLP